MPSRSRFPWQRDPRSGWLLVVLFAAALFGLVAVAALVSPALDHVDAWISEAIRSLGSGGLTSIMKAITFLGSSTFVTAATIAVGIWMIVERRLDALAYLIATVPVGYAVARALQELIGRERPQGVNLVPLPHQYALPSGHTVAASLFCGAVAVIVVLGTSSSTVKKWAVALPLVIPFLVGVSRVYLGVHWFGDVLAAWLYSLAWWGLTTSIYLGVVARRQEVPR